MVQVKSSVLDDIRELVEQLGSKAAAAKALDITPPYLQDILEGKRNISDTILERLGYVRVSAHVRSDAVPSVVEAIESMQRNAKEYKKKLYTRLQKDTVIKGRKAGVR